MDIILKNVEVNHRYDEDIAIQTLARHILHEIDANPGMSIGEIIMDLR